MGKPRVVIVGGGPGGVTCAKALSSSAEVTIIDSKGYFEITWATPRVLVKPDFKKQVIHLYSAIPGIGTMIQAQVTSVSDGSVALDTGASVPYDYLVLAPGSSYPEPALKGFTGSLAERSAVMQNYYDRVKAANSVLIIGGGPVGVETAGEILAEFPDKAVTIVTSAETLIAGKSPKLGRACLKWLQARGAKVIFSQKATRQTSNTFVLTDGSQLAADVTFFTIGGQPNTRFLNGLDILDNSGAIKVNDKLQVVGRTNTFAIGDATNVKEVKLGYLATQHAHLTAKNIQASMDGQPMKSWKPNGGMQVMMVTLGPKHGTGNIGPVTLTGCLSFMPAKIKGPDLFSGKTMKDLGIVVPA